MRMRLTFPQDFGGGTEVFPSEQTAKARLDQLKVEVPELRPKWLQIEPAGRPRTRQEILDRYPILVGHMICHSLGYFTPEGAAGALLAYIQGEEHYCEWYSHMTGLRLQHNGSPNPASDTEWKREVLKVGKEVVEWAFRYRRGHTGYMSHYPQAKALVEHVRAGGQGPVFASWF